MNTEELLFTKVVMLETKVDVLQSKLDSIQSLLVEAIATINNNATSNRVPNKIVQAGAV